MKMSQQQQLPVSDLERKRAVVSWRWPTFALPSLGLQVADGL